MVRQLLLLAHERKDLPHHQPASLITLTEQNIEAIIVGHLLI